MTLQTLSSKPLLGISECLTNSIVRYDGKKQFKPLLITRLEKYFILMPICPEVECGLGVPRPPVELVNIAGKNQVIGRDDKNINITMQLKEYSNIKVSMLTKISGYLFKAKSPSCGVMSTPIHDVSGNILNYSNGVFAQALLTQYPKLPIIDDAVLITEEQQDDYIKHVLWYAKNKLLAG